MDKRTFLGFLAAALGGVPGRRLFGRSSDDTPPAASSPTGPATTGTARTTCIALDSIEQVRSYVREHDSMKALGTRHCFNGIADSPHALISLKPMDRVVVARPQGVHGDRRGGDDLRPSVPLSPREGLCPAQPRLPAPHLRRRRLRHGDARLGRQEREPGDGGLGPGARHARRRRPDPLRATRTATPSSGPSSTWGRSGW